MWAPLLAGVLFGVLVTGDLMEELDFMRMRLHLR